MAVSSRSGAVCALLSLVLACTDTGAATAPAGGGDAGATSGRGGSGASGGSAGSSGGSDGSKAGAAGRGTGGGASGRAGGSGSGSGGRASGAAGDSGSGNDGGSGANAGRSAAGGTGNASSGGSGGTDEAGGGDDGSAGQAGSNEPDLLPGFSVAVIGSSTAAGEGASSSARGWVSLLARSLEETLSGESRMNNLAVGGYTTSNLLPGSGSSGSIDDALEREPNLILVALAGSNDLSNGVSTDTFLSRLGTIREAAVDAGVPIFFLSTAPKDLSNEEQETLADWAEAMGDEFEPCWTPNAANYAPCFIDIFAELASSSLGIADEYSAGDGIHLNDAGHERIFEIAEPIVRAYACTMTECE